MKMVVRIFIRYYPSDHIVAISIANTDLLIDFLIAFAPRVIEGIGHHDGERPGRRTERPLKNERN